MAETRTERSIATRETETRERKVRQWQPASILPEPNPVPGFAHRWVRISILDKADPTNMSGKLREGWEPVRAEDYPELMLESNQAGNIEIGGLVLCKIPSEFMEQRNAYYNTQARAQMESVTNTLFRDNDPRMPLFKEHKTETSRSAFGSGS
jgi:hypothetical protein